MQKELRKHLYYYSLLTLLIAFGIVLSLNVNYDKNLKMLIFSIIVFFYILWGLLHHYLNHDLSVKIVIEYILIGALGMSLFQFLVKLSM